MRNLQGMTAVVTGASYGVGRAVAIGLAREGCNLVLAAKSEDLLVETQSRIEAEGRRAVVCTTDISQFDQVQNLAKVAAESFGKVDIVVNCAFGHIGEDQGKSLVDVLPEELAAFAQTSIVGTWLVSREFAPLLKESGGRMLFVIADWGIPQHNVFTSTPGSAEVKLGSEAFVSAKYAITGLVNSMERQLGVTACGIYPGIIASARPSAAEGEPQYFDIDDPVELVEQEEAYQGGWAIPLVDMVGSVVFALKCHSTAKAILLKPATPDYDGVHM